MRHNVGPITGRVSAGTRIDRNYTAGPVRCIGGLSRPHDRRPRLLVDAERSDEIVDLVRVPVLVRVCLIRLARAGHEQRPPELFHAAAGGQQIVTNSVRVVWLELAHPLDAVVEVLVPLHAVAARPRIGIVADAVLRALINA